MFRLVPKINLFFMSLKAITILNGGLTAIKQFSKFMNCLGYCAEMYVCEIVFICGCKIEPRYVIFNIVAF